MLALVPLATVALVVRRALPAVRGRAARVRGLVVRVLLPGVGQGAVREAVLGFAEQAARLTGFRCCSSR